MSEKNYYGNQYDEFWLHDWENVCSVCTQSLLNDEYLICATCKAQNRRPKTNENEPF